MQRLYVELDDSDTKQQIDATLVEDKEEDDSDEESDSQNELSSAPTIELKVALGKLCENPGISALLDADKDTEGEEQTTKVTLNDSEEAEKVNSHEKVVSEVTDQGKQNVATSTTSKKRKALIQELSWPVTKYKYRLSLYYFVWIHFSQ